ncbi:hypothetical protein MRX96_033711 [Rhipicephalus microplus]
MSRNSNFAVFASNLVSLVCVIFLCISARVLCQQGSTTTAVKCKEKAKLCRVCFSAIDPIHWMLRPNPHGFLIRPVPLGWAW